MPYMAVIPGSDTFCGPRQQVELLMTDYMAEDTCNGDLGLQKKPVWRRILPVIALGAGFAGYFWFGLDEIFSFAGLGENREMLQELVATHANLAAFLFVATYTLCVAFSLPAATLLTIAGGFLFGPIWGTTLVVLGATMGATGVFLAARTAFGDSLRQRAGPALKKLEAGFQADAFSYLLVLRLVPLFPFFLVNIAPAFVGVSVRTYIVTTLIGIIPGALVYASVGSGIGMIFDQGGTPDLAVIFEPEVLLPILGLSLLAMVPVVFKRFKALRSSPIA
jgi:uncharacterized membrane protein YdjX (TVP38/TMEM64 family)